MPTLIRRGQTWHCQFRFRGRRYRFSTRTADKAAARTIALEIERQTRIGVERGQAQVTFADCVRFYLEARKDDRFILPIFDALAATPVTAISPEALRRLALKLYPAASAATRNRQVLNVASAIINHAADLGYCDPIRIKRFKVRKQCVGQDPGRG